VASHRHARKLRRDATKQKPSVTNAEIVSAFEYDMEIGDFMEIGE
jgi:hypothetical protein